MFPSDTATIPDGERCVESKERIRAEFFSRRPKLPHFAGVLQDWPVTWAARQSGNLCRSCGLFGRAAFGWIRAR